MLNICSFFSYVAQNSLQAFLKCCQKFRLSLPHRVKKEFCIGLRRVASAMARNREKEKLNFFKKQIKIKWQGFFLHQEQNKISNQKYRNWTLDFTVFQSVINSLSNLFCLKTSGTILIRFYKLAV